MPGIRTPLGVAIYVLITGRNNTIDTKQQLFFSTDDGSYIRNALRSVVLITGIKYTGIYVTVFQYNVLISGMFLQPTCIGVK